VTEPAPDLPQPEPERYPWREPRDREVDVLALVTCALRHDHDAAVDLVASLDDAQRVSAIWVLAVGIAACCLSTSRTRWPSCGDSR
jgi:hypothetical protein